MERGQRHHRTPDEGRCRRQSQAATEGQGCESGGLGGSRSSRRCTSDWSVPIRRFCRRRSTLPPSRTIPRSSRPSRISSEPRLERRSCRRRPRLSSRTRSSPWLTSEASSSARTSRSRSPSSTRSDDGFWLAHGVVGCRSESSIDRASPGCSAVGGARVRAAPPRDSQAGATERHSASSERNFFAVGP